MKPYAGALYNGKAWQDCRSAYKKSKGGLCERCLSKGIYKAGEIVHHKVHISPENINNPQIALNWENLELLCRDCHALEHSKGKRYKVDELGRVTVRE